MLYVFHVDTGTMMTLDMNLALESVAQLKEVIERSFRIAADKQVLLVSGGESLDPTARVCSYSAGTDTNPIFLFSKSTIESVTPPSPSIDTGSDMDLKDKVDASLSLPSTYNTVVARAQLAQQFCELAREQTRICERLVHEQHLQQQGWAAVVANLEDITTAFRNRADMFEQSFSQYLGTRDEFMSLIQSFAQDLGTLARIPIIRSLLQSQESSLKEASEGEENGGGEGTQGENQTVTLLQWISAKDNQSSLEQVAEQCTQGLEKFDSRVVEILKGEVNAALEAANKVDMKEIKGLEERLFGLEQLMYECRRLVQEQVDLAASFVQNQNRAGNLGDPCILPDLCQSHRRQLLVMLKNHQQLRDIRRRCSRAKEELSINLYHRLRWIMYVENHMCEVDSRLVIYHESLKRLRRHLEVVQQIHLAPTMYLTAVGEVVRRRTFSQAFLGWASDLACQMLTIHSEEVSRRREFHAQFQGHFLNTLFPGLEDAPPPFATQAPPSFDADLPPLDPSHLQALREQLPDIAGSLSWPDLAAISHSFPCSHKSDELDDGLVKTLLQPVDREPTSMQDTITNKEPDRCFDSETDTEEFEKVVASPMDLAFDPRQTSSAVATLETGREDAGVVFHTSDYYIDESLPSSCSEGFGLRPSRTGRPEDTLVRLLQENLGTTRGEVERLKTLLQLAGQSTYDATSALRDEICLIRAHALSQRDTLLGLYREVLGALDCKQEAERRVECERNVMDREKVQRLTVDHELEMCALKNEIKMCTEGKDEEIRALNQKLEVREQAMNELRSDMERRLEEEVRQRQEVTRSLEIQVEEARDHCNQLQIRIDSAEADKQRTIKEVSERLAHDYKTELEGLRSRFRLMATSMERSPSDSSLEKIERPDMIEIASHENILAQVRLNLSNEKETALKDMMEQLERERNNQKMDLSKLREKLLREREAVIKETLRAESARWEQQLEMELKQARSRTEQEKQVWFNEAMRRVVGEKEKQLEALRSRESTLMNDCQRLQETIRRLTDDQTLSADGVEAGGGALMWPLLDKVDALEAEKKRLEEQLMEERRRRKTLSESSSVDMNTSVALVQETASRDVATSPDLHQEENPITHKLTRSTTTLIQQGKVSIGACNVGDAVLVIWDETHRSYTILQEAMTLYFLHADCVELLGLQNPPDGSTQRLYVTGEVVEKEYCHAKKSENRYRVPKGTKFYRVRVRPLVKESLMSRSHHHHHSPSASTTTSTGPASS